MINDIFKRMNVVSRQERRGFLHNFMTESFVGDGNKGNNMFPIQEISKEQVQDVLRFVGTKGVPISKLASHLGVHYLRAYETAEALAALGMLRFNSRDFVAVTGGKKSEGVCKKNLSVWRNDPNIAEEKECDIYYSFDNGLVSIDRVVESSSGVDVTDKSFLSKSIKEELDRKSRSAYEKMKAARKVQF